MSNPGFIWCLLGALLGCVGGLFPVNDAFALLILILVCFFLKLFRPFPLMKFHE
jgi:hypothetical protein